MELNDIIKSTSRLFMKYGIKSVTMDDVAKALSISKKTLYQYVNDKTDLVEKCVFFLSNMFDKAHSNKSDERNVVEKYIDLYKEISSIIKENNHSFEYDLQKYYPQLFQSMKDSHRKLVMIRMTKDMEDGIEQGFFRSDLNIKKIVVLHILRIESLKDNDILQKYNYTLVDIIDEMFNYHFHAIATQKGINEYKRLNLLNHE